MKIFVFGSTGMLGRYVAAYFESKDYDVIRINRKDVDAEYPDGDVILHKLTESKWGRGDAVINCMGLIKQKMAVTDTVKAIRINSIFPWVLDSVCRQVGIPLIHISTDCCFSGRQGGYLEHDPVDAEDIYGLTKAAGELTGCSVIRTSIIGEASDDKSLVEWVRSKNGEEIQGYTHHLWSGVTCLQLAKAIEWVIDHDLFWTGVRHYFSTTVTKAALVKMIVDEYCLDIKVNEVSGDNGVDRTLATLYPDTFLGLVTPDIRTQIREQRGI